MTNADIIDAARQACRQELSLEISAHECRIQVLPNRNPTECDGSRHTSPPLPPFEWYVHITPANKQPVRVYVQEVNAQTTLAQVR